jgi:hypothetical protein
MENSQAQTKYISSIMLQRAWAELDYRLDILHVTNGAHVQVY